MQVERPSEVELALDDGIELREELQPRTALIKLISHPPSESKHAFDRKETPCLASGKSFAEKTLIIALPPVFRSPETGCLAFTRLPKVRHLPFSVLSDGIHRSRSRFNAYTKGLAASEGPTGPTAK